MKKIFYLGILLSVLYCKEVNETKWLQSGTIQLTKPLIDANSTIIDSSVTLSSSLRLEGAEIYYTNNGDEPTKESILYNGPFQISEAGLYKFKAFHSDWKASETAIIELVNKGLDVDSIYWHTPLKKPYPGQGEWTVVNHEKGTLDYKDPNWVGMDSVIMADVFFKEPTVVSSANIGYLESTGAWIFPPEEVQILRSYDGVSFSNLIEMKLETPLNNDNSGLKNISLKVEGEVLALRIIIKNKSIIPEWHPAKGNAAWLFTDEWIFY